MSTKRSCQSEKNKKTAELIEAAGWMPCVVFAVDGDRLPSVPLGKRPGSRTPIECFETALRHGAFVGGERVRIGIANATGDVVGWIGYRVAKQTFDAEVQP